MNISALLSALTGLLPAKLQPFAKAIIPALVTLIAVVAQIVATHGVDPEALTTAISGLVLSVVTFLVPNRDSDSE